MSEVFLNSQDSLNALYQPFTNDPDDSALTHPSLTATHIHEGGFSQPTTTTSGGYFRVTIDDAECHEQLKGFTV